MGRRWFSVGTLAYLLLLFVVFPFALHIPFAQTFWGDAAGYSKVAINMIRHGFYTYDGIHPFINREPGQSALLALMYLAFGAENPFGVFAVNAVMLFISSLVFCTVIARRNGQRVAGICFVLLLTSGSIFHAVFSAYREVTALVLLLLFLAAYFSYEERPSVLQCVLMGVSLSGLILTYYTFVFFPIFFLGFWCVRREKISHILVVLVVCFLPLFGWMLRNASYDGRLRIIDNQRSAVMWYVRGEQAEKVHGLEPFRCLWSEYVSRNWTGRSDACSFNGLMHTRWPNGFDLEADYKGVAREAQAKIAAHFGSYAWFSLFEVLELHIPYVGGGWSHAFNLYAIITAMIMYLGCAFAVRSLWKRDMALVTLIIGYNLAVYVLTDATPRYLVPVLVCYAFFAAIGFDSFFIAIRRRFFSRT